MEGGWDIFPTVGVGLMRGMNCDFGEKYELCLIRLKSLRLKIALSLSILSFDLGMAFPGGL